MATPRGVRVKELLADLCKNVNKQLKKAVTCLRSNGVLSPAGCCVLVLGDWCTLQRCTNYLWNSLPEEGSGLFTFSLSTGKPSEVLVQELEEIEKRHAQLLAELTITRIVERRSPPT